MKKNNKTKIFSVFLIIFIFLYFYIFIFINTEARATNELQKMPAHQAGELLVKLKFSNEIYKFKFSVDRELRELIKFYNARPEVEYVEPNYLYQVSLEPLDTYYTQQIYLSQIQAHKAWNITTGSDNVTIAIIDSGVDINHPDLKNNIWTNSHEIPGNGIDDDENGYTDDVQGWDFVANSPDPKPKLEDLYTKVGINHGTVVAGIAAAEGGNNEGITGVTWQAKIMPLRVLDGTGSGDTLTVAKAIDYAREKGAHIINLSFVGQGRSLTLENAIKKAYEAGILVIAAAGNEVKDGISLDVTAEYPVCHDGPNGENWVIGVAAVDSSDRKASFSNYGKSCVDLTAPGVGLFSTVYHQDDESDFENYYLSGWTGTSVSVPQVAGAVALIKSLQPNFSLTQLRDIILNNSDNIEGTNKNYLNMLGTGRLNVFNAIAKTLLETPQIPLKNAKIITMPAKNGGPHVRIFKKSQVENQFFAFEENFRGSLSGVDADLDSDGKSEIIVGLGAGTYPWVKIFNQGGTLKEKIIAYNENFRGGVEVTVGDVDGDDTLEIITAPGPGGGPHIRIFSSQGILKGQFFAFDKSDRSGLEIASGDVNQDGKDEIAVAKKSGSPEVKVFDASGNLLSKFTAYHPNFKGGVHLAVGDLNNDGQAEIITGAGFSGGPQVRVFNKNGQLRSQFFAYDQRFHGGVYVATGDVDGNGNLEIVTGAGPTGGPHIRVFDINGGLKFQFFAYDERFRGGVRVATEE